MGFRDFRYYLGVRVVVYLGVLRPHTEYEYILELALVLLQDPKVGGGWFKGGGYTGALGNLREA